MKSALASIGKNLILIGIVALCALNYFYGTLSWQMVLGIQAFAALAYIFLSCYEYLNTSYKAALPVQRYPYFSGSYVMFRTLKIGVFFSFAVLLYTSGNAVKYLYPVCLTIGFTETIITLLKYKKSLCFVNIYANYLLIAETKLTRLFASEIVLIEFRHNIFYFMKKNLKTVQINLEFMGNREDFVKHLNIWITRNHIRVSDESKEKINNMTQNDINYY
ncbi:MAG: hypothetical protein KF900_12520 [Bacteroidetes bacterium]|nr:hypothetical protein [Bacteroidota bacterium]